MLLQAKQPLSQKITPSFPSHRKYTRSTINYCDELCMHDVCVHSPSFFCHLMHTHPKGVMSVLMFGSPSSMNPQQHFVVLGPPRTSYPPTTTAAANHDGDSQQARPPRELPQRQHPHHQDDFDFLLDCDDFSEQPIPTWGRPQGWGGGDMAARGTIAGSQPTNGSMWGGFDLSATYTNVSEEQQKRSALLAFTHYLVVSGTSQRDVFLRFQDPLVEQRFLVSYMSDWNTRIVLSIAFGLMMAAATVSFTSEAATFALLCYIMVALCFINAVLLAICKFQNEQLRDIWSSPFSPAMSAIQSVSHSSTGAYPPGMRGVDDEDDEDTVEFSSRRSRTSREYQQQHRRHHHHPSHRHHANNAKTIVHRMGELATITEASTGALLYLAVIVYTVSNSFFKGTCVGTDSYTESFEQCYKLFNFDSSPMMMIVAACTFAPLRIPFHMLFVFCVLCSFAIANSLQSSQSYVKERYFSSLIIFCGQQIACVVWLYRCERGARDAFAMECVLELQNRERSEVRRMAKVATARAVVQPLVRHIVNSGTLTSSFRNVVVCQIALKTSARWAVDKGPLEIVQRLARWQLRVEAAFSRCFATDGDEGASVPLPPVSLTAETWLGDTARYAAVPSPASASATSEQPPTGSVSSVTPLRSFITFEVWTCALQVLVAAIDVFDDRRRQELDQYGTSGSRSGGSTGGSGLSTTDALTTSTEAAISNGQQQAAAPAGGKIVTASSPHEAGLAYVSVALALGSATVSLLPSACATIISGPAALECQSLVDIWHHTPTQPPPNVRQPQQQQRRTSTASPTNYFGADGASFDHQSHASPIRLAVEQQQNHQQQVSHMISGVICSPAIAASLQHRGIGSRRTSVNRAEGGPSSMDGFVLPLDGLNPTPSTTDPAPPAAAASGVLLSFRSDDTIDALQQRRGGGRRARFVAVQERQQRDRNTPPPIAATFEQELRVVIGGEERPTPPDNKAPHSPTAVADNATSSSSRELPLFALQRRSCVHFFDLTFTNSQVEREYRHHQSTSYEPADLVVQSIEMIGLAACLIFICGMYDVWSWELRSSLPYVVSCGLSGLLLLAVVKLIVERVPVANRAYCTGVLELTYWLFMFGCILASVMPPESQSIVSGSILPWTFVGATITIQRPRWFPPLGMWMLEGCFCVVFVAVAILPTRSMTTSRIFIQTLIGVAMLVFALILRVLLDGMDRERYAARRMLQQTHITLERESQHLLQLLRAMAPTKEAARRLLKRGRTRGAAVEAVLLAGGQTSTTSSTPGTTPIRVMTTNVEDLVFAVLCIKQQQQQPPPTSKRFGDSSSPAAAVWCSFPHWVLVKLHDTVAAVLTKHSAMIVKSLGDVFVIGLDEGQLVNLRTLHRAEVVQRMTACVQQISVACNSTIMECIPAIMRDAHQDSMSVGGGAGVPGGGDASSGGVIVVGAENRAAKMGPASTSNRHHRGGARVDRNTIGSPVDDGRLGVNDTAISSPLPPADPAGFTAMMISAAEVPSDTNFIGSSDSYTQMLLQAQSSAGRGGAISYNSSLIKDDFSRDQDSHMLPRPQHRAAQSPRPVPPPRFHICAWVGIEPIVGAVLGSRKAPSFEWFSSELSRVVRFFLNPTVGFQTFVADVPTSEIGSDAPMSTTTSTIVVSQRAATHITFDKAAGRAYLATPPSSKTPPALSTPLAPFLPLLQLSPVCCWRQEGLGKLSGCVVKLHQ